jgi:hypothetical protein
MIPAGCAEMRRAAAAMAGEQNQDQPFTWAVIERLACLE